MLFKRQITKGKGYFIFVSLVAIVCLLGSIFSLTYAYIIGNTYKDSSSKLPFVKADVYYNTTKLETINDNGIDSLAFTGSINSSGAVTIKVGSTNLTGNAGETINLPLYIKNSGNVNAEIISIFIVLEIKNGEDEIILNDIGGINYLTFNSGDGYAISENTFIECENIVVAKNSADQSQFLSGVSIGSTVSPRLCETTFTIHCFVELGQIGIEDL